MKKMELNTPMCSRATGSQSPRILIICGIIGAIIFIAVYGVVPLNVTNDHWILNGYMENDVIQHYAGWMAFRNSDWTWPLGKIDGFGDAYVTFTDSIPWVSIFFKLFRSILPETFQFFGIYILGCFILQGVAAGKILSLYSNKPTYIGGVLLYFAFPQLCWKGHFGTVHWLRTGSYCLPCILC